MKKIEYFCNLCMKQVRPQEIFTTLKHGKSGMVSAEINEGEVHICDDCFLVMEQISVEKRLKEIE